MTTEQPTIESMNRVIAEFMGYKFRLMDYPNGIKGRQEIDRGTYWQECKYHYSWDQLKPVIDKIGKLQGDYPKQVADVMEYSILADIISVHSAVYEFIDRYNTHK